MQPLTPIHAQLQAELSHDLRSYRARVRERTKRAPILNMMKRLQREMGL